MPDKYYAHTPPPGGDWHLLTDHLGEVARLAHQFGEKFNAAELACWAGWMHDFGKFSSAFQEYLQECYRASLAGDPPPTKHVNHSSAGAIQANDGPLWFLSHPIAGHHAGLSNRNEADGKLHNRRSDASIREAMTVGKDALGSLLPQVPQEALEFLSRWITDEYDLELLVRMIFSALVDADRLDTERHFDPDVASLRGSGDPMESLLERLRRNQDDLMASAQDSNKVKLNNIRREVYESCLESAEKEPGVFTLTVPTGGGKTRSSLAFALKHAAHNHLDRVIVAIPYTSIIDQTVSVYRGIFGDERVVEHHSGAHEKDEERQDAGALRRRMATENWNAPIVVTTTVQLFESLFSNRPNRCRKLHNIARSVVIIDEVQTLPPELLSPILDVLRRLVAGYRVSLVLCTATQPTLEGNTRLLQGFPKGSVTEIVPKNQEHFNALKRVRYSVMHEEWDWTDVAGRMRESSQALAVLNTRKDALELMEEFEGEHDDAWFHLSTLLCGKHRKEVLTEVRNRLENGQPCHLISTQVVEAGVDLNFPLVLRAFGPLDRIVQAAGRCNREGKMDALGDVIVFNPQAARAPQGSYRTSMDIARKHLEQSAVDFSDPKIFQAYFLDLYAAIDPDRSDIQSARKRLAYESIAGRFKMINSETTPVFVPYDQEAENLLTRVRFAGVSRHLLRKMQPYTVNLFDYDLRRATTDSLIEEVVPGLLLWKGGYSKKKGLTGIVRDPSDFNQ